MTTQSLLYRLINPPIICVLRSPLHALLSRNTMLIEYTGRNTGNPLTTPASYHIENDRIHAFSAATSGWWKNLAALPKVHLTVRGARAPSSATVISGADSALEDAFVRFLQAVPRDARHAGVRLDANGDPNRDDVRRVVPRMVHVHFPIALVSP